MTMKPRTRRFCYYIPADAFVEGRGFRVSVVFEDEPGHAPTGDWPYNGNPGQKLPYFWGQTYDEAKARCARANSRLLGLDAEAVTDIVTSSMRRLPRRSWR